MRHQRQISGLLKKEDIRNEISGLITKSTDKYLIINEIIKKPIGRY